MSLPGGKQCKETLLRKASESAAHVAGFGLHLEGYGPPNLPEGFFDSLRSPHKRAPVCFLNALTSKRLAHIELNRPDTLFGTFCRMLGQKARKARVIKRKLHRLICPG